jgi:integrase
MREDNAVIDIGRRCLDFLKFVGQLHRIEGLVDEDGCIRARKKSFIITAKNGASGITINYWHHNAFPPAGPKNKRHLIAQQLIDRLRRAAVTASASPYLRQRRLVLLRLLEKLGARRSEIVRITVQSVYDAIEMAKSGKRPFLRITTAKRRAGKAGTQEHFRLIPIELHELHFIRDFVKFYRAPIIEKWLLKNVDHGLLLISQNSGAPLSPDTVTLELHYLRIEAGIDGKAHPQMFRHRYITHALLRLIKAHNLKDRSQFEIMFRLDGFKKEVAELTGHKSIASLDSYIDWAFIELYQYDNSARSAIDAAGLRASIRSSIPELEELMRVLSPEQFNAEVLARLKAIEKDLECFEANAASDEALNRATSNK